MNKCEQICPYNTLYGCKVKEYNRICPLANTKNNFMDELGKFIGAEKEGMVSMPRKWISVKDKMPEKGERVLAYAGGEVFEAFTNINDVWQRGGIDFAKWYGEVTHWMPLPNPPKGEDNESI